MKNGIVNKDQELQFANVGSIMIRGSVVYLWL